MIIPGLFCTLKNKFGAVNPTCLGNGIDNDETLAFSCWFLDPWAVLTRIPNKIIAGDTLKVTGSITDYPSSLWTATLVLNGSATYTISSTVDGSGFQLLETAANTALWAPGVFEYVLYVTDIATSTEQYTVCTGQTTISQRADLAATGDKRNHFQIALDNIEAVIEKRATLDQASYSIGGRSLSRMTIDELLKFRSYYAQRVSEKKGKAKPKSIQQWLS